MSSAPENAKAIAADVLVLGASFAGVELVYQLHRRAAAKPPKIVVVDRDREHGYLPLVQERLVGTIDPATTLLRTAAYIEGLPRARFVQGEIVEVDARGRAAVLADGTRITARVLVIALGSVLAPPPSIPGGERMLAHKSPQQLAALRQRLAEVYASADADARVVVVGGGISGCELAGELASLAARTERPWPGVPKVTLVASTDRLVPILHPRVGVRAKAALVEQGVDVRLGARVVAVEGGAVELAIAGRRERLDAAVVVWTGGIAPAPLVAALDVDRTPAGWIAVGPTLQCFPTRGPAEVFACGDAVRVLGGDGEWPTMQRAIECIWQAKVVARNALALLDRSDERDADHTGLHPHRPRPQFAYGVSLGARSLVVYGWLCVGVSWINRWFRRWLMRQYFARYPVVASPVASTSPRG
jgi:NADH dehydrogenase